MAQRIMKVLRHFTQICAYGPGHGSFLGTAIYSHSIRAITSYSLFQSRYITHLLSMTLGCVMT